MRLPYLSIFILTIFSYSISEAATIIRAINNNGNWNTSSTWDLNRIPSDDDHVIIPELITVEVTSNMYNAVPTRPTLFIELRGTLRLIGGSGQLNLSCASNICTFGTGSIPSSGCNCNQIAMGTGISVWKGTDANVTGGSCITGGCFLPVLLTAFDVHTNANQAILNWSLEDAKEFAQIEIERSANGIDFENAGSTPYEGAQHYSWNETIQGNTYYRLKLVDLDNSAAYSDILLASPSATPLIFPNPSSGGSIHIDLHAQLIDAAVSVLLLDALGNQVGQYELTDTTASFSTDEYTPGVYQVIIQSTGFQYIEKVVLN